MLMPEDRVLFIMTRIKKRLFAKLFVFEYIDTANLNRPSVLHSLHALPVSLGDAR